jgi:endoribonuclease Dicer
MLIKHFAEQVEKPYSQGGRRTIFLANNVPLVMQQAGFLRSHTYLNVGEYYGDRVIDDKILDYWDQSTWDKELENNQILVMSPQILVDMLQHSFIGIGFRIKIKFKSGPIFKIICQELKLLDFY